MSSYRKPCEIEICRSTSTVVIATIRTLCRLISIFSVGHGHGHRTSPWDAMWETVLLLPPRDADLPASSMEHLGKHRVCTQHSLFWARNRTTSICYISLRAREFIQSTVECVFFVADSLQSNVHRCYIILLHRRRSCTYVIILALRHTKDSWNRTRTAKERRKSKREKKKLFMASKKPEDTSVSTWSSASVLVILHTRV